MKLIVKARHMDLTPALKSHAEDKLGKAMMRIFDTPAVQVEIELSDLGKLRDGASKECRVTAFIPRSKAINIVEVADDMYKAMDLAHDRLVNQIKRLRRRKLSTVRNRKAAERGRAQVARETLTSPAEAWEQTVDKEIAEFERSTVRV